MKGWGGGGSVGGFGEQKERISLREMRKYEEGWRREKMREDGVREGEGLGEKKRKHLSIGEDRNLGTNNG